MKKFLLITLLLILPFVSASIEIASTLNNELNLGDNIQLSIKVIPDKTTNALAKITLSCLEKELPYYITPISLESSKEIKIDIPFLTAFFEDTCNIIATVESLDGQYTERISSESFTVTSKLDILLALDKTEALPSDTIKIEGTASKKQGSLESATVTISLDDNVVQQMELVKGAFSYNLKLANDIKSGEHKIGILVSDLNGNYNKENQTIIVRAVPTILEFSLNKKEFLPKETLQLIITLLDQANEPINENIKIRLAKEKTLLMQNEIVLFDKLIEGGKEFDFTFNYSTLPKEYTLKSIFGKLEKKETIKILPYQEIEMYLEGYMVVIKNIGNVEYNNKTTIILEKDNQTYIINKKIKVDVGEELRIDLSKEVPYGIYTINSQPKTQEENKTIENIEIKDNRSVYKKGFQLITGGVVAAGGFLRARPQLASAIMIVLILSLVIFFSRKRIKRKMQRYY